MNVIGRFRLRNFVPVNGKVMRGTRLKSVIVSALTLLVVTMLFSPSLFAQSEPGVTLSVTPPLFQLSLVPGETWRSGIRVDNRNSMDVTVVPKVMDYLSAGERGEGTFLDAERNTLSPHSLGKWISLNTEPILLRSGESAFVPFTLSVPMNAEPGGHYAGILIGTDARSGEKGESAVMNISTMVSSILSLRISGEIDERGRVRELSSSHKMYRSPDATFTLRFENLGNVHVRPVGDIVIRDMWGNIHSRVPVNTGEENLGTVLPLSTRKFTFAWKGDGGMFGIGYYSASTELYFGESNKQRANAETAFWVLPLFPLSLSLLLIIFLLLFLRMLCVRYVAHVLRLKYSETMNTTSPDRALRNVSGSKSRRQKPSKRLETIWRDYVLLPTKKFTSDIRVVFEVLRGKQKISQKKKVLRDFRNSYHTLISFLVVIVAIVGIVSIVKYEAEIARKEYTVKVLKDDTMLQK